MQDQILRSGVRLWASGIEVEDYELFVLNEKLRLNERSEGLLEDIMARGTVYGR